MKKISTFPEIYPNYYLGLLWRAKQLPCCEGTKEIYQSLAYHCM